jgi:hypothetical protein
VEDARGYFEAERGERNSESSSCLRRTSSSRLRNDKYLIPGNNQSRRCTIDTSLPE